eukprot:g1306.t1
MVKLKCDSNTFNSGECEIFCKLEFQNPGGSVKDRIALAMIESAEKKNLIKPGVTTLIEATSGNTGIGLAMVAAAKGYRLIICMPRVEAMTERYIIIRAFGAEVRLSDPALKTKGVIELAHRIAKEIPNSYITNQFTNDANPDAHYRTTGPEIWSQMKGKNIDYVLSGVGTGGTLVGVGKYLKEQDPNIKIVCVEPQESSVLQGETHRSHSLTGIGTGMRVPMIEKLEPGAPFTRKKQTRGQIIDMYMSCSTADGLNCSLEIAKSDGLLIGPSSGAVIWCAKALQAKLANANKDTKRQDQRKKNIVVILPSSGVRYLQHPLFKAIRDEAALELGRSQDEVDAMESAKAPKSERPKLLETKDEEKEYDDETKEKGKEDESIHHIPGSSCMNDTVSAYYTKWNEEYPYNLVLARKVENIILTLAQDILNTSNIEVTENLVNYGADSLSAMLLLGKLRNALKNVQIDEGKEESDDQVSGMIKQGNGSSSHSHQNEPSSHHTNQNESSSETNQNKSSELELHGMKIAVMKEYVWHSCRDLAHSLLAIDGKGRALPGDKGQLQGKLIITYCVSVKGICDVANTGNFEIKFQNAVKGTSIAATTSSTVPVASDGTMIIWPFGFLTTSEKKFNFLYCLFKESVKSRVLTKNDTHD